MVLVRDSSPFSGEVQPFDKNIPTKERRSHELVRSNSYSEKEKLQYAIEMGLQDIKIVLSCTDGEFPTKNPRKIREALNNLLGNDAIAEIIKTRQGNLAVTIRDLTRASSLLEASHLGDIPITSRIIDHTKICTKFVLKNVDVDLSLDDIADELTSQGIHWIQLVWFTKPKSTDKIPVVLVKELGKTERNFLNICFQRFRVEAYRESPKICKRCLRFNHFRQHCQLEPRCVACGGTHEVKDCLVDSPKCFRCGDSHTADYKRCPKVLEVGKAQALTQQEKISFQEARKAIGSTESFVDVAQDNSALGDLKELEGIIKTLTQEIEALRQSTVDLSKTVADLTQAITGVWESYQDLSNRLNGALNMKKRTRG